MKSKAQINFIFLFSCFSFCCSQIGEHPAAMQRGCANNTISASIFLYIIILSMFCQQLNRITHGYGIHSFDSIRLFTATHKNCFIANNKNDSLIKVDNTSENSDLTDKSITDYRQKNSEKVICLRYISIR